MIEVSEISKTFGEVQALTKVSFKVEEGQVVGFLGANGAGKTTTMDILCGCIGADEGSARIAGFDITDQPIEAKKNLGYLPDEPPIHHDMFVEDFVHYAASIRGISGSELKPAIESTLKKLDLTSVRKRLVGNLSKGFRQRVALAQAIVHNPKVLVLDEPTEGLDPKQIVEIRHLIQELKGRHTIILSSHILTEVENNCDQIIVIDNGRILKQGSRADLESGFLSAESAKFIVTLSSKREEALTKIRELHGVVSCKPIGDAYIEFELKSTEESLDHILSELLSLGCGVREIRQERGSLEEIFFQLTKGGS